jgi:hypothetical protein
LNFKTHKKKPIVAMALLFFILAPMLAIAPASATVVPTGNISVVQYGTTDVTEWTIPPSAVGTTVKLQLYIEDASNVWAWGVNEVTWNPSVVKYKSCQEGSYIMDEYDSLFIKGSADEVNGKLVGGIGCAVSGSDTVEASEGVLCTIQFTVLAPGNANIHIVDPVLVADSASGTEYPVSVVDPEVTVGNPFVVPEYTWGALLALVAAFVAFFAFFAVKKTNLQVPTFSKHI